MTVLEKLSPASVSQAPEGAEVITKGSEIFEHIKLWS